MEWLVFAGWVISQAKDYPNYYGEEAVMSRNYWAHFLAFQWLALELSWHWWVSFCIC